MKRKPNEAFEDFQERRKKSNLISKIIGSGRRILRRVETKPKFKMHERTIHQKVNKKICIGKRWLNEMYSDFQDRRKVCNAKRRQIENDRKTLINMDSKEWRKKNQHLVPRGYLLMKQENVIF